MATSWQARPKIYSLDQVFARGPGGSVSRADLCPAPYHQHRLLYREATLCSTGVLMHYGMFTGAPGPPGVPIIVRYSSAIAIHWSSGDPGKGPITRYVIEARPSGTPCPSWAIFHSPHPALLRLYPWACFYPPSRKVCMCAIVSETGVWE